MENTITIKTSNEFTNEAINDFFKSRFAETFIDVKAMSISGFNGLYRQNLEIPKPVDPETAKLLETMFWIGYNVAAMDPTIVTPKNS